MAPAPTNSGNKRILFVVEAMGGGVFTYIVDLANALVDTYDMYIAYSVRRQTPENFRDYFDPRIHLIHVEHFHRAINPMNDIPAFYELRRIAREIQPDIIHMHSSKAGAIGRMAFDARTPLFYTPHGYSFLMDNYRPMKRRIFHAIEAFCAKRNCTTISCSKGEHEKTLRMTSRALYVNNGINTRALRAITNRVAKQDHPYTVYTLGRICNQKGPVLFNEIARRLPDVNFLWIGDGDLRHELTSPNITVTGWADRSIAIAYAVNADAFLLTSHWEGLPISLLESMYMRKPCIVSNVIGNKDVIRDGENGYLCDTVDDFVRAIENCRKTNTRAITDAAYHDIETSYNTEVMAAQYKKIYASTMNKTDVIANEGKIR